MEQQESNRECVTIGDLYLSSLRLDIASLSDLAVALLKDPVVQKYLDRLKESKTKTLGTAFG